ncbi:MAG: hypothetical protein KJ655_03525 [Candidatus Thermoplasmatota archaeon]|nr:hypothetical protein [Candidatus Thermoplasmatota archaeon]
MKLNKPIYQENEQGWGIDTGFLRTLRNFILVVYPIACIGASYIGWIHILSRGVKGGLLLIFVCVCIATLILGFYLVRVFDKYMIDHDSRTYKDADVTKAFQKTKNFLEKEKISFKIQKRIVGIPYDYLITLPKFNVHLVLLEAKAPRSGTLFRIGKRNSENEANIEIMERKINQLFCSAKS